MRRLYKVLIFGGGFSGLSFATYKAAKSEGDFDINNIGAARFGRAAVTVKSQKNKKSQIDSKNFWQSPLIIQTNPDVLLLLKL